jgi:O-acetyl-ADP-ribose deacetylase (regulator of RNase III)
MISSTILDVHGSGTIAASRVFLVVIRNTDKNSLDSVYARIFSKATYLNLSSLAIPLLGTGAFGSSIYDATDSIVMALENSNIQGLKVIFISNRIYLQI